MTRRWYPRGKPPHGRELWRLLQEEVETPPPLVDFTDSGRNQVGSFNYLEAKLAYLQRENGDLREALAAAHELISRSANVYLRYFRARHRVLVWWKSVRG